MGSRAVAVIDDHAPVRDALGEMLSVFGFEVERHESALAFLAAMKGRPPGCIVADVRMPGMDGIELVRELRARGAGRVRSGGAGFRACGCCHGRGRHQGRRAGLHRKAGR